MRLSRLFLAAPALVAMVGTAMANPTEEILRHPPVHTVTFKKAKNEDISRFLARFCVEKEATVDVRTSTSVLCAIPLSPTSTEDLKSSIPGTAGATGFKDLVVFGLLRQGKNVVVRGSLEASFDKDGKNVRVNHEQQEESPYFQSVLDELQSRWEKGER
jgi:hypothetical protein